MGRRCGRFAGAGRIAVFGLGGDDNIHLAGSIRIPAWLDGGDGNDRLKSAKGADVLLGGAGDDDLNGAQGADVVIGGLGADRIHGGPGDDLMIAGHHELRRRPVGPGRHRRHLGRRREGEGPDRGTADQRHGAARDGRQTRPRCSTTGRPTC